MQDDFARQEDSFLLAMSRRREFCDGGGIIGWGSFELFTEWGDLKEARYFQNLITDAGDLYYATRGVAAVVPATPADATKVTGMKLGTGASAASKGGANAALGTYITASNVVFDATYPQISNLGTGLGVNAVYRTTWPAGTATNSAITEAVIVNDAGTNATSSAANSISRTTFTAINKTALDVLVGTWNHKFLGT